MTLLEWMLWVLAYLIVAMGCAFAFYQEKTDVTWHDAVGCVLLGLAWPVFGLFWLGILIGSTD